MSKTSSPTGAQDQGGGPEPYKWGQATSLTGTILGLWLQLVAKR